VGHISDKTTASNQNNYPPSSPYHLTKILSNKKENNPMNTTGKERNPENISTSHFLLDKTSSSMSESLTPRCSDPHGKILLNL
jgi:hypothetical protein